MDQRTENRLFIRIFAGACALVALLVLIYWLFGDSLIRAHYDSKQAANLGSASVPDTRTFATYRSELASRFWYNLVLGIPLSLLVIFGLYRLNTFLLAKVGEEKHEKGTSEGSSLMLLWAGLAYAAVTVVYFWPALRTFGSAMIGPPEDNMACYWTLEYGSRHLLGGGTSFVTDLFFPEGASFHYHAWSVYSLILFSLFKQVLSTAASYNLLIMLTFPLASLGAYLLIQHVLGNRWLALVGGFLFAFNPAHLERSQHHLNIATIQFLPLFVLYYLRCVRESKWWLPVMASLLLLLNATVDWNYLVFGGWFMLFGYVFLAIGRRKVWLRDVIWKSGAIMIGPLVILSPWLAPMVRQAYGGANVGAGGHNQFVVDLLALITPHPQHLLGNWSLVESITDTFTGMHWEGIGYLGFGALGLVIFMMRGIVKSGAKYLLGGLAFLIMALGSQPHFAGMMIPAFVPGRLVPMIPLIANSRAPGRLMVFVYLFWSIIVAMALGLLWRRLGQSKWRNPIMAGMVLLLVLDYSGFCRATTEVNLPPAYSTLPRGGERYGILDLPSGYVPVERYMMYQELHRIPIVQGWVSRKAETTLIDTLDYADLGHQRRQLTQAGVRYVVLHKQYLPNDSVDVEGYRRTYQRAFEDSANVVLQVY